MWNLFSLIASLFAGYRSYREERHSDRWIWPKVLATLGFAALEAGLILLPVLLPFSSRFFLLAFLTCTVISLANLAWFLPLMRRWKTPSITPGVAKIPNPTHFR